MSKEERTIQHNTTEEVKLNVSVDNGNQTMITKHCPPPYKPLMKIYDNIYL